MSKRKLEKSDDFASGSGHVQDHDHYHEDEDQAHKKKKLVHSSYAQDTFKATKPGPCPQKEPSKNQTGLPTNLTDDTCTSQNTVTMVTTPHTVTMATTPHTVTMVTTPHTVTMATTPHTVTMATTPHTVTMATTPHTVTMATTPHTVTMVTTPKWKTIRADNLDLTTCKLYSGREADDLLAQCENTLVYNTGRQAQIHLYGKWHDIPRRQVAHGDAGLSYSFSGTTVPARPWTPLLQEIRARITAVTGKVFNFVLINRYKDGNDYISEHRDDEKDLVAKAPIASFTLGQERDFVFRHAEARGKNAKREIAPVTLLLKHGQLILMNHPTNVYWYHSLPKRKKALGVRINMKP